MLKRDQNIRKMVCYSILSRDFFTNIRTVLINNHTAVWGSWYDPFSGKWGYTCCQSTIHVSYCAGEAGIEAARASSAQHLLGQSPGVGPLSSAAAENSKPLTKSYADSGSKERVEQNYSKLRVGEGDIKIDNDRLAKALQEERKRKLRGNDDGDRFGKKKKGVPESGNHDVTEEELGRFFWPSVRVNHTYFAIIDRGVSIESSADGGSHGQLCRYGDLTPVVYNLFCQCIVILIYGFINIL